MRRRCVGPFAQPHAPTAPFKPHDRVLHVTAFRAPLRDGQLHDLTTARDARASGEEVSLPHFAELVRDILTPGRGGIDEVASAFRQDGRVTLPLVD